MANNAFERSGSHHGRAVLAMDCGARRRRMGAVPGRSTGSLAISVNGVPYDELRQFIACTPAGQLVAVEGFCSSGKTTIADQLAAELGTGVIHTDKFANKFDEPPSYIECLRLGELSSAIHGRDKSKACLIEGICLRHILAKCGAVADRFVYVRRKGQNGLWYDEFHLDEFERGGKSGHDDREPHLSDMLYHSLEKPHRRADIYYDRVETE